MAVRLMYFNVQRSTSQSYLIRMRKGIRLYHIQLRSGTVIKTSSNKTRLKRWMYSKRYCRGPCSQTYSPLTRCRRPFRRYSTTDHGHNHQSTQGRSSQLPWRSIGYSRRSQDLPFHPSYPINIQYRPCRQSPSSCLIISNKD